MMVLADGEGTAVGNVLLQHIHLPLIFIVSLSSQLQLLVEMMLNEVSRAGGGEGGGKNDGDIFLYGS